MTQATRRDRGRAETDREIRQQARALLVNDGPQAVTLRAIARELGITAPALYRYYSSREDLIHHLRLDVCNDLAADLERGLAEVAADAHLARVLTLCRGFRTWALAHPQEFALVFATPVAHDDEDARSVARGSFGRIFLVVAARVLATGTLSLPADSTVPVALLGDMTAFRAELLAMLAESGVDLPPELLGLGTAHLLLQCWVRLYGQVALEVFGQVPIVMTDPEALFESVLADLTGQFGLTAGRP
ncbi:TetR/AcrR family transcriptional regulator [Actinokineospora pegani]|uniref:TetR/AcrR family transcriptional regulator n=1 Tax=Actinokineospora pegani TaxID=2654637 RepID=UPI0012E9F666|nr:TetR/AcrR family transcriptional regulator [Actinokineospora pegani]